MNINVSNLLWMCIILLVSSCNDDNTEKKNVTKAGFSIPGAVEQVVASHPDGAPKLSVFVDEKSEKKIAEVEFHTNGKPRIHKKFENEILNGETWAYYDDGKPWSLNNYKNGVNHGPYKTWHENGQLFIDGKYENGKEEGDWLIYYPNGKINTRGIYRNGEKVGIWTWYNLEGSLKREQNFDK